MKLRALAVLFAVLAMAAPISCGDDSSPTTKSTSSESTTTAPKPTGRRLHQPEEYEGVYAETKKVCSIPTRKKVAEIAGTDSTRREDIARAVANGYKPKLRRQAYRGCLAGLG